MASGSSKELTRGARDHRMGATRCSGHVVEPWVAHAGRRRLTVRGHVAGGPRDHAVPRGHSCGAPSGRFAYGGPTSIVGPW